MTTDTMELRTVETMEIRQHVDIDAPIDIAFEALLEEIGPGGRLPDGQSMNLRLEPWPGGRWFRDLGEGRGHFWGHVQVIKPPALLEICGPMACSYPALNHVQYRLKTEGTGTRLSLLHRAMGVIPPEHREGMPEGWKEWLQSIRDLAQSRARDRR
jgi:uncharacterized protein YndB with AHSA1/START domain